MPIKALPSNTVRAIGSSQALTDAASVVKELVDNAIDGRATHISIEVSTNTLDDIRVKDNGHGIPPDDRAMICTNYCTSKIRDYQDLETIGGRSLGFRGQALASAAEMSGIFTITTRIEGEGTAVELKFNREGHISGEKRTSHPVGTTVKVEKFLQNLPVRRQAAEKISAKTLANMKRMLQAYALARPHLRLSLKLLKAKDRKGDWRFPKSGALSTSRLEASFNAATDLFGKKLTSQCDLRFSRWSGTGEQIDETVSERSEPRSERDEAYTLEATMAKLDCDGSALSNVGQYLSVDSRPVSYARGTLKQVVSLYKSHLRSAIASGDNAKVVDPFLCLSIACPPGSYDANVEPAKDDVLFANSELLLKIVERWFHSVYGGVQPSPTKPVTKIGSALMPRGIELLLARKEAPVESAPLRLSPEVISTILEPRSASISSAHTQIRSSPLATSVFDPSATASPFGHSHVNLGAIRHSISDAPLTDKTRIEASPDLLSSHDVSTPMPAGEPCTEPSSATILAYQKPIWKDTMYTEVEAGEESQEEDLEIHSQEQHPSFEDLGFDGEEHLRDVNISNPWTFAKLNSAMRPLGRNKQLHTPRRQDGDVHRSIDLSSDDLPEHVNPSLRKQCLPRVQHTRSSPEAAYPTPSPFPFPQKARGKRKTDDASVNAPTPPDWERHKHGALDTWVQKSLGSYDEPDDSPDILEKARGPSDLPYPSDFVSARSLPPGGTPLSEIPDASQRPRRKHPPQKQQQDKMKKPFPSPVNDPNCVWFQIGKASLQKQPEKRPPKNDHHDTAATPTVNLRDNENEGDDSVISAPTERPLPPMHPDLAITLDYEARKQKAGEAHRKVLREQASAGKLASKAKAYAIDPPHPRHTTPSPHKNRQAKAIAALHTFDTPPTATRSPGVQGTAAFEPSDPRAYLLRLHRQGEQGPESLRGKSKRQKTAMLPFETVRGEDYVGDLTLVVEDVNAGDVDEDMKESGAWDSYVRGGDVGAAFATAGAEECKRWAGTLRAMLRAMYTVEGEADVNFDLSKISQAQAAGHA